MRRLVFALALVFGLLSVSEVKANGHHGSSVFFVRDGGCGYGGGAAISSYGCGVGVNALGYGGCGGAAVSLYGARVFNAYDTFAFRGAYGGFNTFAVPTNAYVRANAFYGSAFVPSFTNVNVRVNAGVGVHHGLNLFGNRTVVKTRTVIHH